MADKPESDSSPGRDLLVFLGILLLLWIVWFYTGGPERAISQQGPFIKPPAPLDSGQAYFLPSGSSWFRGSFGIRGGGSGTGISYTGGSSGGSVQNQLNNIQDRVDDLSKDIQTSIDYGTPSPYRGEITIDRSSGGPKATTNQTEYVVLKAASSNPSGINITGWRLISGVKASDGTSKNAYIPNGSNLPRTGEINPIYGITLSPGERAYVATGGSPIGISFRVNICSGYLGQFQKYSPSLQKVCPAPKDDLQFAENTPPYESECDTYVGTLPRCEIIQKPTPLQYGSACGQFVKSELTYNACIDNHKNRTGFYQKEWRIFLNSQTELWKNTRDIIKLVDTEGKTVDMYAY